TCSHHGNAELLPVVLSFHSNLQIIFKPERLTLFFRLEKRP
ncbi:unnamed protein product, partial [Allacma fusca]